MGHDTVDEETGPALSADSERLFTGKYDAGLLVPITRSLVISLTNSMSLSDSTFYADEAPSVPNCGWGHDSSAWSLVLCLLMPR